MIDTFEWIMSRVQIDIESDTIRSCGVGTPCAKMAYMNTGSRHGKSPNKPLAVRMTPEKKTLLHELAAAHGTTASTLVTDFLAWWMGEPDATLPQRAVTRDDLVSSP